MKRSQISPAAAAIAAAATALPSFAAAPKSATTAAAAARPNVILIITDQQQVQKVSYLGFNGFRTPAIDRIAAAGYAFTNAYCVFPLSVPSRVAIFTGHYPSSAGVRGNSPGKVDFSDMKSQLLGNLFDNAGYDTWYGGKIHLPYDRDNTDASYYGFRHTYTINKGAGLGERAAGLIDSLSRGGKPYFLVASFLNPHDICGFDNVVDKKRGYKGMSPLLREHFAASQKISHDEFFGTVAPLLPDNFPPTQNATDRVPGFKPDYTQDEWRLRRWVYNRLVEDVDQDIAPIVNQIESKGLLDNTIVIFTSDHGEMDGSHGIELKNSPYGECQKIPFIFAGPGIVKKVDKANAVSNGNDLMPTLCDFIGAPIPDGLPGKSLKPLLTGKAASTGRDYIFCEGGNWFQVVYQGRYKYTLIEDIGLPALLVDLQKDPGEKVNLIGNPACADIEKKLSGLLAKELSRRGITPNPNRKNDMRKEGKKGGDE